MTLALLTMSRREMDRAELMLRVRERRLTQVEAAVQLGLSVRQVERLYRAPENAERDTGLREALRAHELVTAASSERADRSAPLRGP